MQLHTFSIAACDLDEGTWGVAVASKFLAAASIVSWARAGVGAVATQALARVSFGAEGLTLMANGKSAQEALDALLANDPQRDVRQLSVVDAQGRAAAHTGANTHPWAGHHIGEGFVCLGNILAGPQVVGAMAETFRTAKGNLADRLVATIMAGEAAGGDWRGKQSAGVLVVRAGGGYGGDNDRYIDLRVDDDSEPIKRLAQLVNLHHLFFGSTRPEDRLPITPELARELQSIMLRTGDYKNDVNERWDGDVKQAFYGFIGKENLEERWSLADPNVIDRVALEYLRERYGR